MENKEEIKLMRLETGLLWPFYQNTKAWSANKLTKFIKEIEYKEIPMYILQAAAARGKAFHQIIQEYFQNGNYPPFVDEIKTVKLSKLDGRIHETVNFLKKNKLLKPSRFVGSEKLFYTFYKGELLATYVDVVFHDYIIELKTSHIKTNDSPLALLTFEIQLLIQYLCTGKDIYLLWSTGEGVVFSKFQISLNLLKVLDVLIDLAQNETVYSTNAKKIILQEIINLYPPRKLVTANFD